VHCAGSISSLDTLSPAIVMRVSSQRTSIAPTSRLVKANAVPSICVPRTAPCKVIIVWKTGVWAVLRGTRAASTTRANGTSACWIASWTTRLARCKSSRNVGEPATQPKDQLHTWTHLYGYVSML